MDLPKYVQIEPVGQCNLRCQMCAIQFRQDGPPYGPPAFMNFETYTRLIDELEGLRELQLQGLGEPMMHPRYFDMLEYAARKGIRVTTNSNLTLLSARRAARCVTSGLAELHISIDGATAQTYERIRVGAHFERVVRNIERLLETRARMGSAQPRLQMVPVVMRQNLRELPDLVRLAHSWTLQSLFVQHLAHDFAESSLPAHYRPMREFVQAQTLRDMRVIVSDQSAQPVEDVPVLRTLRRVIEARGGAVEWHYRVPSQGIAEQRQFLLERSSADAVLYLDDDVLLEPWVVAKLLEVLRAHGCAFVGAFPAGLSYRDDVRPQQQVLEFWDGAVEPEAVEPESREWRRWNLHRAANLYHAARRLAPGEFRLYKVTWLASCILYDRARLLAVGGFSFWPRLPRYHSGEEVLVQNLLMRRWGGCGLIPSGAYYAEMPSTVLNEAGSVDGHALALLPEMVARYAPDSSREETI